MDRRTFLALCVVAVGTAGCTGPSDDADPGPKPPPDDPDAAVRTDVAVSERALIALYATTLAAHPQLADALAPLRAHHEAHLARVGADPVGTPSGTASAPGSAPTGVSTASPGSSGSDSASASARPAPTPTVEESLAALAGAEDLARAQRITSCDAAASRSLARDLTLVAASEAQHAAVLEGLARAARGAARG